MKMKLSLSTILIFAVSSNIFALECIYVPIVTKDNPTPELSPQGSCGVLVDEDTLELDDKHLRNLYFSSNGLASIRYEKNIFYVNKQGKAVRTHYFDNGADYFVEGLARTISNGKYGFMDNELNVVIKAEYDFAFPFNKGVAVVCNGCDLENDGEHKKVVGGMWGAINKVGKVLVPVKYKDKELQKSLEYRRMQNRSD